jgi:cysteine desulfurase
LILLTVRRAQAFHSITLTPNAAAENLVAKNNSLRRFAMKLTPTNQSWVYMDNNATTRTDPRVVEAMLPFMREEYANPSAFHSMGVSCAEAVRIARSQVSALIGARCQSEIIFNSGGSESNNTAILSALQTQTGRSEIVTSTVEHPSILALCSHLEKTGKARVHRIPVDNRGSVNLDAYSSALSFNTALVSMQLANNETGVMFPVETLASMAHAVGALFHSDAVQAAGRVAIDVEASVIDMLSISAHKMHGPNGIGALYIRNGVELRPLIYGGRQERGRRAGTENTPAIVGFGLAAEIAAKTIFWDTPRVSALRDYLEREILRHIPSAIQIGDRFHRLPNTLNVAFENIEADSILMMLDRELIAASSGSACASGAMKPSHVLNAMKIPFSHLRGSIRFSLSRETSDADIDRVLEVLPRIVIELQDSSTLMEAAYA